MRKRLLFITLLCLHLLTFSQKSKLFYDDMGLQGRINYTGAWEDSTLPKSGKYELSWRSLHNNTLQTYKTSGVVNKNMLSGKWTWEQASWAYMIDAGKALEPAFNLKGEKHLWEASFSEGKAHGLWKFILDSIPSNASKKSGNLQITAGFDNGRMAGKFNFSDNRPSYNYSATGECDKYGFATGAWEFRYSNNGVQHIEKRKYDSGILTELSHLKITGKDTVKSIKNFEDVKEKLNALKNTKDLLAFNIGEHEFESDGFESDSKKLFLNYLDGYFLRGWDLPEFKARFSRKGPVFKKIQYPLSARETEYIALTKMHVDSLTAKLQKRARYQTLHLNRGRSVQLDAAIGFKELAFKKLRVIDSLLQLSQLPDFSYINRFEPRYLNWKNSINADSIVQPEYYPEDAFVFPLYNTCEQKGVFACLYDYVQLLDSAAAGHIAQMDLTYQKLQKEGELLALENLLGEKIQQLDSMYLSSKGTAAVVQKNWVKRFVRKKLQTYSNNDDYATNKLLGHDLSGKMDTLATWYKDWSLFDSMPANILDRYTVFEYNPYNGKHDIEIRKKRRFYNKIASQFWPWIMDRFNNAESWEEWVEIKKQIEQSYSYLIDFAQQDERAAKRIEKRIRKEKSPEKILKTILSHV